MTLKQARTTPQRGTRPRNRRATIVAAATDLFYRRGFDQVSMSDIAEAVAIGPSALYRHFPGKQALLHEVMTEGLAPLRELLSRIDLHNETESLPELASLALDHRQLGVLWQRESRHMTSTDYTNLRIELRAIGQLFADRVRAVRPELSTPAVGLLSWSTISALISTSFHHLDLPRTKYEALFVDIVRAVLDSGIDPDLAPPSKQCPPGLIPSSRREALLDQAVRMFAQQGYTGVGIEDIGAAVGIAGPSIYNHFSSKRDMLTIALQRGSALLYMDLAAGHRVATTAADGLRKLVCSYVRFTMQHHQLVDLMITELEHLPPTERHGARQAQHDYISEWVHLLRAIHTDTEATTCRVRVHAALTIANNAARTAHLHSIPGITNTLETICTDVLRLPP